MGAQLFVQALVRWMAKTKKFGSRRLAAIPLPDSPTLTSQLPDPEPGSSLPMLGVATAGLLCIGYTLKRRCLQAKEKPRDSFGFLPDSTRGSLNACEKNV